MSSSNRSLNKSSIIHVAVTGDDANSGSLDSPLRHINAAAQLAQPGDTIRVLGGVYRERVDPPRGGISESKRITYEAAPGARVELRGSERVPTPWVDEGGNVWRTELPKSFFAGTNPFAERIRGDWFKNLGRPHHTAAVYVNSAELQEACMREDLQYGFWYAEVVESETRLWIYWSESNPNEAEVEVNARPTIIYPSKAGINYITIRGFIMRHAATNWAPPTAEQIGLIGTNWSKGWIIENCTISHSRCVGITLGKHGDEHDNTSADSAEGYDATIRRAAERGWNRDTVGGHMVRRNVISHCGQAGIVGSLGAIFSEISHNVIHDIHIGRHFSGEEQAAIKFHGAIDTLIAGNHIFRSAQALWLDWMSQGTRVTRNLCHDNIQVDLFVEVNHGPFVVDHNIFLSSMSLLSWSQGGAFVHNLFGGRIRRVAEPRRATPWHREHSTEIVGSTTITGGDERYYNNLFAYPSALKAAEGRLDEILSASVEDHRPFPNFCDGNILVEQVLEFECRDGGCYLETGSLTRKLQPSLEVSTERLGKNHITGLPYRDTDGRDLDFLRDYFGNECSPPEERVAGPFALSALTRSLLKVTDPVLAGS